MNTSKFSYTLSKAVEALDLAAAELRAVCAELSQPVINSQGWSMVKPNGVRPEITDPLISRNTCAWNDNERHSLLMAWMSFTSVETMAQRHLRSDRAIRTEMQRLLSKCEKRTIIDHILTKAL
jgi:hypothetical protein